MHPRPKCWRAGISHHLGVLLRLLQASAAGHSFHAGRPRPFEPSTRADVRELGGDARGQLCRTAPSAVAIAAGSVGAERMRMHTRPRGLLRKNVWRLPPHALVVTFIHRALCQRLSAAANAHWMARGGAIRAAALSNPRPLASVSHAQHAADRSGRAAEAQCCAASWRERRLSHETRQMGQLWTDGGRFRRSSASWQRVRRWAPWNQRHGCSAALRAHVVPGFRPRRTGEHSRAPRLLHPRGHCSEPDEMRGGVVPIPIASLAARSGWMCLHGRSGRDHTAAELAVPEIAGATVLGRGLPRWNGYGQCRMGTGRTSVAQSPSPQAPDLTSSQATVPARTGDIADESSTLLIRVVKTVGFGRHGHPREVGRRSWLLPPRA